MVIINKVVSFSIAIIWQLKNFYYLHFFLLIPVNFKIAFYNDLKNVTWSFFSLSQLCLTEVSFYFKLLYFYLLISQQHLLGFLNSPNCMFFCQRLWHSENTGYRSIGKRSNQHVHVRWVTVFRRWVLLWEYLQHSHSQSYCVHLTIIYWGCLKGVTGSCELINATILLLKNKEY